MKNKLYTLAAALALLAVIGGFYAAPALAAVVKAALVQDLDAPGRQPFARVFVNAVDNSLVIPADKRLVVQYASAQFTSNTNSNYGVLSLSVSQSSPNFEEHYIPLTRTSSNTAAGGAPVVVYVEPGQTLNIRVTDDSSSTPTATRGSITGYFVDCSATTPCSTFVH